MSVQRKGQYLTLEHVFFFVMGLAMTLIVYSTFSSMASNIKNENFEYQLLKVGENIRWNIVGVFISGNETNSNITLTIRIPRYVSGCIYQVSFDNNLNLNCTENKKGVVLGLYGIDISIKNRIIYSSKEEIKINYESGNLWLE